MRTLLAATVLGAGLMAGPVLATEWIACADAGGAASFDFLVGTLDVLAVSGLTITVGEEVWASDVAYGPGEPVVVGQAFEDAETIRIDAMDEAMLAKIAELRLFKAEAADGAPVYGGTLVLAGHGAWAVTCAPA